MKVEGVDGQINKLGNLCKYPKFGYQYLNDNSRITKPMVKKTGSSKKLVLTKLTSLLPKKSKG